MSLAAPPANAPANSNRIELVDLARGIALLAMFIFHFAYDLSYFGLIETDIQAERGWRWFARLIAGSFLTLVGISLVLATRSGLNRIAYLTRLAMVAVAALLVTVCTRIAMPESFIFFGILHHVAVASVLALPFLVLPTVVLAAAAALSFALPALAEHVLFDQPSLVWLGLSELPVRSADFVPVFPWFGCVLSGMVLARMLLPHFDTSALGRWRAGSLPARAIVWGGRNSLIVYLVHQPVFIGLLLLAAPFTTVSPPEERPFLLSCQRSCTAGTLSAQACERVCGCTVGELKRENIWSKVLTDSLTPEESARTTALAQACVKTP
ncbi:heparan-alpha-glucosaminide N-acetyltransferase [Bosea sp. PAMC 26642]|uniref:heparan-alpha-glucosaminide N-acetyltransferase n=1 Tax=Bosea sp. (strain PAMC 26642) TaxID=1792307 RepID=UPI0007703990|nr:heparan-alpha-glucosaminide N-acetyltransferase [Bosea sp. PAMC 26642]AMJ60440.1 hypothetical protein AXW83_09175 [Bosea sp. PAMC 26642]